MQIIINQLQRYGKTILIVVLLTFAFISGNSNGLAKKQSQCVAKVLGESTHITPIPSIIPTPTSAPITVINNIILPTQTPTIITQVITPTPVPTIPTPTSTPVPTTVTITSIPIPTPIPTSSIPTPTPVVLPTAIPTLTPTVSPTPIPQAVTVLIDYAGQHETVTYSTPITIGENAWQAVQSAVGLANIHYKDYGGSLGIFITGFNGIDALSNQYYDFQVNGTSSNVGVSSYTVQNKDTLKFVLTSF